MLDYTTCCKLRDAGYPQTRHNRLYPDKGRRTWVTCPNSDELIAAIQQRWPDYGIAQTTNMSWPLNPPRPARIDGYDAWVIGRDAKTWDDSIAEGTGDSPAAALAALYLALVGGEQGWR